MYRRFFRHALPLFVSLAVIYGLSVVVERIGRDAPRPFDRLIVETLPEIPDLSGWSAAFVSRLEEAHSGLEVDGKQRNALGELAFLYHANGFLAQARSCYLGLEAYEPENPAWPYLLGVVMADSRDKRAVAQHFVDSLELDPSNSMAYLRLGHAYREAGLLEEARQAYQYRLVGAPEDPWAMVALGEVALYQENDKEAVDWLLQAKALDGGIEAVYDLLYEAYLNLGDSEAARETRLEGEGKALESEAFDPRLRFLADYCYESSRLLRFAREEREAGDMEAALELLERAAGIDPENREILVELNAIVESVE